MKTLNKALVALTLLVAFPAIQAMDAEVKSTEVSAQSWLDYAKTTGTKVWNCQKGNRYLQVGEVVVVLSAAGAVSYKYNKSVNDAINKAAVKAKAGYDTSVTFVKDHKKATAGAAAALVAVAAAGYAYKNGYFTKAVVPAITEAVAPVIAEVVPTEPAAE